MVLVNSSAISSDLEQNFQLAVLYQDGGRLEEAEAIYRQLLEVYPDQPEIMHRLGLLLGQSGRIEAALALFERARKTDTKQPAHWLMQARCLLALGRAKEADKLIGEAIRHGLDHPAIRELQAQARSAGRSKTKSGAVSVGEIQVVEQLLRQGRYAEVDARAQALVRTQPRAVALWQLLARARLALHRYPEALIALDQLVLLQSKVAEHHFNRGFVLEQLGRQEEALVAYDHATKLRPELFEAHNNLGILLRKLKRPELAKQACEKAVSLRPRDAEAHSNLGDSLMDMEHFEDAVEAYRSALALKPQLVTSYFNLSYCLSKLARLEEGLEVCRRALDIAPDNGIVYVNMGNILSALGRYEEALTAKERAMQLGQLDWIGYGTALNKLGRSREAIDAYLRALENGTPPVVVFHNLGIAYTSLGDIDKALENYGKAIAADPQDPAPYFNRSRLLLSEGEFETGWIDYEYGLLCDERKPNYQTFPRWHGENLVGKTLLICAEQGLGDEIMFASILPGILQQAGRCIIECDAKLMPVYRRSFAPAEIVRRKMPEDVGSAVELPAVDYQIPIASLALGRRNDIEAFPRHSGYLKSDSERVAYWQKRLDELGPGIKVGISWQGGVAKTGGQHRSIPLAQWLPILKLQGVHFVSLQYTECQAEIAALRREHGIEVLHWQEAIDDYDETAALVCALDLVISVQTAIVHLAGALGRPVWAMLPIPAEWRYMADGDEMPWYPSVRLLRQKTKGNWNAVIKSAAKALEGWKGS